MSDKQYSENRYRRLFEAAKDGILILDAETGMVADVNPYLLELLGYTYEELCGQYIWDIGVFKDIAASKEAFKTLQEEKYIHYEDLPLETRDGDPIAVEFVSNVYLVDDVKVIQCNIRDITDRKRAEEMLRLSNETYRGILDSITEAVYIQEEDGRFLDMNVVTEKLYGYTSVEFVGQTMELITATEHGSLGDLDTYRDQAFHGKPQLFEHMALHKDGTIFPEYVSFCLGYYFGKKVIIAVARDITERKRTEQILRDVQRRESIGIFSAGIAHDFNNLLGAMMGNVTLAEAQLPAGHPALKNIERALAAMERTADLTKQILAYSGAGKARVVPIDIGAVVEEHVSLFKATLAKNVKLVLHLPSTPIFMAGDPGQIEQIVMNLIINGGEAVGDKQGRVSVTLSECTMEATDLVEYGRLTNKTLVPGSYALLEVSDTGDGMSEETLNKIFDPFFTTKFSGRGLGLSAVLGIISGHEGGLLIDTSEGAGTTFRVLLPMCAAPEPIVVVPAVVELPAAPAAATVLVIDDEEAIAVMARMILETQQYTVLVEQNPILGIELYRQHQADIGVVLLDLTMPEMSGGDVADTLLEIDPEVKIIISSGYSEKEVYAKVNSAKVAGFLPKPYTMRGLLSMVHTVLRQERIPVPVPV